MTNTPHQLLVEIDQMVAQLEEHWPAQLIFEALSEYLTLADEFDYLR